MLMSTPAGLAVPHNQCDVDAATCFHCMPTPQVQRYYAARPLAWPFGSGDISVQSMSVLRAHKFLIRMPGRRPQESPLVEGAALTTRGAPRSHMRTNSKAWRVSKSQTGGECIVARTAARCLPDAETDLRDFGAAPEEQ